MDFESWDIQKNTKMNHHKETANNFLSQCHTETTIIFESSPSVRRKLLPVVERESQSNWYTIGDFKASRKMPSETRAWEKRRRKGHGQFWNKCQETFETAQFLLSWALHLKGHFAKLSNLNNHPQDLQARIMSVFIEKSFILGNEAVCELGPTEKQFSSKAHWGRDRVERNMKRLSGGNTHCGYSRTSCSCPSNFLWDLWPCPPKGALQNAPGPEGLGGPVTLGKGFWSTCCPFFLSVVCLLSDRQTIDKLWKLPKTEKLFVFRELLPFYSAFLGGESFCAGLGGQNPDVSRISRTWSKSKETSGDLKQSSWERLI